MCLCEVVVFVAKTMRPLEFREASATLLIYCSFPFVLNIGISEGGSAHNVTCSLRCRETCFRRVYRPKRLEMPITVWCPTCTYACGVSLFFDSESDFEKHRQSKLHISASSADSPVIQSRSSRGAKSQGSRIPQFKAYLQHNEKEIKALRKTGSQFSELVERRFNTHNLQ